MDDGESFSLGLLLFVVLLGLNALFVAAEFAYVTVRATQMRRLASSGNRRASIVLNALKRVDFYVAAAQLGITIATIAIGFLGEPVIAALIEPPIEHLVGRFAPAISHSAAIVAAFAFVTGVHIVVGEFMPKTIALQSPDKSALWLSIPMEAFVRVFRPLIWLLNATGNGILRLLGMSLQPVGDEPLRSDDIAMALESSASAGLISRREFSLTRNTLRLSTLTSETLMVPRSEIIAIPRSATTDEVRRVFAQHHYTRYPVFEGSLDNITGIVDVKNTVFELAYNRDWCIQIDPPVILPVSISVDQALASARAAHVSMVVLIDEYGGTAGILTLFDVMQYLTGGLPDEHRHGDSRVLRLPDGSFDIDGLLSIVELQELLGIDLADLDAHTVGGLVMELLGRLPETGDSVELDGYLAVITSMDERRVNRLVLTPPDASAEESGTDR